jgi:hypothetical protein
MTLYWLRMTPCVLAIASNSVWGAFPTYTEIITTQGLRPISELHAGDLVVSMRDGREALRPIQSISSPHLMEGFVLQTEGGQPLLCSSDQLFWTLRGWQTASELECGEAILTAEDRWVPLVFPPLPHTLQAVELCLEPVDGDLSVNDRIFWAGPQRLLCHNDLILFPVITICLSTGQVATLSGLTFAAAVSAVGTLWLTSELETRLNRLGYPDAHILSIDTIWMEPADAAKQHLGLHLYHPPELKPWFEQPSHEFGLSPIPDSAVPPSPTPLQWTALPPATREALLTHVEQAVAQQLIAAQLQN